MRRLVLALALLALRVGDARADTHTILGGRFDVRGWSDGDPARRVVLVMANEGPASTDPFVGDPTVAGATLRVVARGDGAVSDETFDLPAAGWISFFKLHDWPVYKGFIYSNAVTGGAVRSVVIKRSGYASPEGTPPPDPPAPGIFRVKVLLVGRYGPLDVLPPNPGTDGGIVLTLGGGDAYCVGFGSAAGGRTVANTAHRFAITKPTAEGCP